MNLAALDRRVAPEAAPDRLGERLRTIDDEQTRHRWIEAALDQVVDQRLHHSAVLGCTSIGPSGCLMPSLSIPSAATSTTCSLMWMPSICTTMMSSPDRSAPIHAFMRAADNATKCREA